MLFFILIDFVNLLGLTRIPVGDWKCDHCDSDGEPPEFRPEESKNNNSNRKDANKTGATRGRGRRRGRRRRNGLCGSS